MPRIVPPRSCRRRTKFLAHGGKGSPPPPRNALCHPCEESEQGDALSVSPTASTPSNGKLGIPGPPSLPPSLPSSLIFFPFLPPPHDYPHPLHHNKAANVGRSPRRGPGGSYPGYIPRQPLRTQRPRHGVPRRYKAGRIRSGACPGPRRRGMPPRHLKRDIREHAAEGDGGEAMGMWGQGGRRTA